MKIVNIDGSVYEATDYREKVQKFTPSILEIIPDGTREDIQIQKNFLKRLLEIDRQIKSSGRFQSETCFFDIVFEAEEGKVTQKHLLEFIEEKVSIIQRALFGKYRKKIRSIIVELLNNYDLATSRFYSRIGEIAALALFTSIKEFQIIGLEEKLSNGKSADILIKCDDEYRFIDFFSITISEIEKLSSNEEVFDFIVKRFDKKWIEKYSGLSNAELNKCSLMPILWCDYYRLIHYKEAIYQLSEKFVGPIGPIHGLVYFEDKLGTKKYDFLALKSVYKRFE
jgi:hypothetical protein